MNKSPYSTSENIPFCYFSTGCCPNQNLFKRSLKRFLPINLGEAEDQRFELFETQAASSQIAWSKS